MLREASMENPDQIKLFDQGGHGCLFYPGISCDGTPEDSKYITKIHAISTYQQNEIYISSKIKQIERFAQYFSPIISSCKIDLAEVNNTELNKCDFIRKYPNKDKKYMSTKTLFISGISYAKYLNVDSTAIFIGEIYKKLIIATKKMASKGICHFDIKDSNIIIKSKTNNPIIIDFGISFIPDEVNTDAEYKHAFYVYSSDYRPWSIDIVIISYLVQKYDLNANPPLDNNDIEEMTQIITIKLAEIENIYNKKFDTYRNTKIDTIKSYANTPCKKVVDELKKNYIHWDKYSVAIMTQSIAQHYNITFSQKIQRQIEAQILY